MAIDQAILEALNLQSEQVSFSSLGSSFSSTGKLSVHGGATYFVKYSKSQVMIEGECESYRVIDAVCPGFCPTVVASGPCESGYFLVTSFLTFEASQTSLAQNLARLHGSTNDKFGFHVSTCCADTVQDNTWTSDWTEFFIQRRLRPIAKLGSNAQDSALQELIEESCTKSVPRLLGSLDIKPALIHGDLWSGNARAGQVYDSCAVYAHSEFEISIMRMFGGFDSDLEEYEQLKARDEPTEQFNDRIALYMTYHQLNHSGTGQGSSYKESAKRTLKRLLNEYG